MPRRNLRLLLVFIVVSIVCSLRASPYGRVLVYAMKQIELRSLTKVDQEELFEGALEGMMSRLDDYSAYYAPQVMAEFQEMLDREFGGVGIEIRLEEDTKQLIVASPLVGAPAYEAGVRAGDKILRIDGKSTQGLSLEDAAERMRGEPGKPVILTVLHKGEDEPADIKIVRAVIRVDTVLGDTRKPDGSWDYFLEGYDFLEADERIGYLRINSFAEQTGEELKRALDWLVDRDLRGLILDVRDDPGGMLEASVAVCDLFIDPKLIDPDTLDLEFDEPGVIVTTRRRDGRIKQAFWATSDGTYSGFPVAVLVNRESASASEIVAACLQDYKLAVVVGERTFGKGTVQEIIPLEANQGVLKLTTASYWRPSGKDIHHHTDAKQWGVSPDPGYEVKLTDEELDELRIARRLRDIHRSRQGGDLPDDSPPPPFPDPQLQKAVQCIRQAAGSRR